MPQYFIKISKNKCFDNPFGEESVSGPIIRNRLGAVRQAETSRNLTRKGKDHTRFAKSLRNNLYKIVLDKMEEVISFNVMCSIFPLTDLFTE